MSIMGNCYNSKVQNDIMFTVPEDVKSNNINTDINDNLNNDNTSNKYDDFSEDDYVKQINLIIYYTRNEYNKKIKTDPSLSFEQYINTLHRNHPYLTIEAQRL